MSGHSIAAADFPPGFLEQYQGNPPLAVAIAFLPLEVFFVGLRFYARRVGRVKWGADDTLILPGAILCIALCACTISNVIDGEVGYHQAYLMLTNPQKLTLYAKYLIVVPTIYLAAVLFPKLAILAIYLRIFTQKPHKIVCYVVAGLLIANWIGSTVAGFLTCAPFKYLWDKTIPGGYCFDINSYFRWASLVNIITDVIMLILPLPVIWKIQTTTNIKIGLTITFATGSLGLITSIIRFASFFGENAVADGPWAAAPLLVWTIVETGTYLIAACLPTYRPLAIIVWEKTPLSTLLSRFKTAGEMAQSESQKKSYSIPLESRQKEGFMRVYEGDTYNPRACVQFWRHGLGANYLGSRALQQEAFPADTIPFRKRLKDEAKQKRAAGQVVSRAARRVTTSKLEAWELTVGLEVHAQLNTERKLFSDASTSISDKPNSNTAFFDLALPGSQPVFQRATLLPALRAALALRCNIERRSKFDRKHYFYQDQPAGYQITQYYEPFARDGSITLYDHDGIAPEDGRLVKIGIKQVQMEQDTAKTILQPPHTTLLDFNRVGHPLIEIITLPQIHHPQTAAACVRKIQSLLQAVNAVTTGMEMGGLRADVNVSIRRKGSEGGPTEYCGISGLGQRTEIKNLSSFKAVEDAIVVERNRQIALLESGGHVEGETRGWSLGSTETRKLRGKEGEVDYRYMPDPDIAPILIGQDLVEHLRRTLPELPDGQIEILVREYNVSLKDAKILVSIDDGERLDYFHEVIALLVDSATVRGEAYIEHGRIVANWILHEIGGLLSASGTHFSESRISAGTLASIIRNLNQGRITGRTAKYLLSTVFEGDNRKVEEIIQAENLELRGLTDEEYKNVAQQLLDQNSTMADKIRRNGQVGKLQWFIGQMMRGGEGKVEAIKAEIVLKQLLGLATSEVPKKR